jgi:hypothetical protein
MKFVLIGCLLMFSALSFADSHSITVDRQFFGENVFGNEDGTYYKFTCGNDMNSAITESVDNSKVRNSYSISDSNCQDAVREIEKTLKSWETFRTTLTCDEGAGPSSCELRL